MTTFDPKKHSPTGVETYLLCPRKFWFQKVQGEAETKSVDLIFGSAVHAAVRAFYANKFKMDKDATLDLIQKIFLENWKDTIGTDKKNKEIGLDCLQGYVATYYKTDLLQYRVDLLEAEQYVPMPNGTLLHGIVDRLYISPDDYVMVVDTKTTSSALTDWYFKDWTNSFQLGAYIYMVEQILGHCDAVQIDAIRVPRKGKEDFVRRSWPIFPTQKANWLNTYLRVTDRIMELKEEGEFFCNPQGCGKWGGCEFLERCTR